MSTSTTIKVSRTLHDCIATRARREHVTLATAIEHALDEADEREFWTSVRAEHAELTDTNAPPTSPAPLLVTTLPTPMTTN